jgi:hypothetical protein
MHKFRQMRYLQMIAAVQNHFRKNAAHIFAQ